MAKGKIVEEDTALRGDFFPFDNRFCFYLSGADAIVDVESAAMAMEIRERDGTVIFGVRVAPGARRDAIEGEYGGALKVRLTAPPVDNQANEALCRLLAARLNVRVAAVRIVAGEKSRSKRVAIAGVTAAQVVALAAPGIARAGG